MSLQNKFSGDLKRKSGGSYENEDESNPVEAKICKKMVRKKMCCVNGCGEVTELHTFPKIYKHERGVMLEDSEKIERIKLWIQFCENDLVSVQPLYLLNQNFFICSRHFNGKDYVDDFRCLMKKRLKTEAVPSKKLDVNGRNDAVPEVKLLQDGEEMKESANVTEMVTTNDHSVCTDHQRAQEIVDVTEEIVYNDHTYCKQSYVDERHHAEVHKESDNFDERTKDNLGIDYVQVIESSIEVSHEIIINDQLHSNEFDLSEGNDDVNGTQRLKVMDENSRSIDGGSMVKIPTGNSKSFDIDVGNTSKIFIDVPIVTTKTPQGVQFISGPVTAALLREHEYCKKDELPSECIKSSDSEKKITKECCVQQCSNTNREHCFFSFPKISSLKQGQTILDFKNLCRFKEWVVACGFKQLLLMDPNIVHKKYFVCACHFESHWFTNSCKNRLKPDAVPTLNCSGISSNALIQEYSENLKKWIDTSFNREVFFTRETCANAFVEDISNLSWKICKGCNEKVLISHLKKKPHKCEHRGECWKYSSMNNMDPGEQPEELKSLTFIEEQVIAKSHPVISVFKVRGHQYTYKGNVISFPQNVQSFASQLPHKVKDLDSVICIKFEQSSGKYHDFYIRQERVRQALYWLKENNPSYSKIEISEENLMLLPTDGYVTDEIQSLSIKNAFESVDTLHNDDEDEGDNVHQSGVPYNLSPHQDDAINRYLKWGTLSTEPINERDTPGFIPSAFPTLFPYGSADLHQSRLKEVKTADYFRHLMNYKDGRFAQHPTFRFFAYNLWQRWTALCDGSIFVRNNKEFQNMTVTQLKELIMEKSSVMRQIMYQASNIKGSKAYWNARSNELTDMVEQLGLPTIFLTLSCADGHWEYLYKILTPKDVLSLSAAERRKLVQDNPHIVDLFFDYRVNSLIEKVLVTQYKVVDYWYRIEYQHRGSAHLHGIFWIENAPDVSNIENESQERLEEIIKYFSGLIDAWNPIINPDKADTHPCRKSYQNVENFKEDLAQLLHMVQRHVCSSDYCHRLNKKTKVRECRFKFPKEMQEHASLQKNEKNEIEFKPRRNDPNLNKFNAFLIQLWRANMDIAPVISKKALLAYLAKYISKCEVRSQSLQEIFESLAQPLDGDLPAKKLIHKVFMRSCAERDISAQEVCHSLMRLKLHSAGGRQFVIVNLSDKKWIKLAEEDENCENGRSGKSVVEKYRDRPNRLENVSLWDFAQKYTMSRFSEVKKENIVRVFPRLKLTKEEAENELYYRQKTILHIPWRDESKMKDENETWQELFEKNRVNDIVTAVNKIGEEEVKNDDSTEYETSDNDSSDEDEKNVLEELLSSRLGPKSEIPVINLGNREVDTNYNWMDSFDKFKEYGTITDFESYIEKMKGVKSQEGHDENNLPDVQLTHQQQDIVDIVKQHVTRIKTGENCSDDVQPIKRIIIQGKAGTGKSLIIKHLRNLLKDELGEQSYLLATPTGVSAVLINGKTLHSIFKLPRQTSKFSSLKGEQARDMANIMTDVKCLILDEFSMVGCSTLAMINRRCKDALGCDEDFGGLMVLLLGDLKQLPPVKDYSFYSKSQKSILGKEGKLLIDSFQKVYLLEKSHRQANDDSFLKLIDNLSDLKVSPSDYVSLSSRFVNNVTDKERDSFQDALHLFATKEEVKQYNMQKLSELKDPATGNSVPVLKIPAKHNCAEARKESSDNALGLEKNLLLSKGCKIMLRSNLWIQQKLCNGTMGTVHDILYAPGSDSPSVVLCQFPTYTGPSLIPGTTLVPIKPILQSWTSSNGVNCTRYQFPITLCYGCSIHKSQGMTLDKAVIDIGHHDFSLGLSYVAFSRVRSMKDLLIKPFLSKRLVPTQTTLINLEVRNDFLNSLMSKI